ncbi:DUF2254 domain-containing protein [Solimonas sp. K1W22B-7]|uniref:DUF2254 family protein n=1 Tax=Solimonas sp. K1W22B-7 TaxID=2303331 RepID=UPI000E33754F|nr:DUF2254 family protein [Solimonas sp. K1W22B-7]AXQ30863.1 DUF2254 domain-containing protein [Solimonas sp. K1W22B-7]
MDDRKFALRLLVTLFSIAFLVFWLEAAWEFLRAVHPVTGEALKLSDLHATAPMVRTLASSLATSYNTQIALLLTFIALAIPITANMYTPKLIEIFARDRINLFVLCSCALLAAHALFSLSLSFDAWTAQLPFFLTVAFAICGWLILLPYYFYVLSFVDPLTIIKRVHRRLQESLEDAARGRYPVRESQRRVNQRIVNLGSVLLRAVDRADRDVCFDAIATHILELERVRTVKPRLPAEFFAVDNSILVGASRDAIRMLSEGRVWMEHRLATQLILAYKGMLGRMPDGISVISSAVTQAAHAEARDGDPEVFRLLVRVLNTFTREAIKKKENATAYNVVFNYKLLIRQLLVDAPALVPRLVEHACYYANYARHRGLPFIYELVSYELAGLAELAYERDLDPAPVLLEAMLQFEGVETSAALVKSRAMLGGYFEERGMREDLAVIEASLHSVSKPALLAARNAILAVEDAAFWEMTDRGTDLDYVEPARRRHVCAVIDRLLTRDD